MCCYIGTNNEKIKPCPWCGENPNYSKYLVSQNFDSNGNMFKEIKDLLHEKIECVNKDCFVRPILVRVNTKDIIEIWNDRNDCCINNYYSDDELNEAYKIGYENGLKESMDYDDSGEEIYCDCDGDAYPYMPFVEFRCKKCDKKKR